MKSGFAATKIISVKFMENKFGQTQRGAGVSLPEMENFRVYKVPFGVSNIRNSYLIAVDKAVARCLL